MTLVQSSPSSVMKSAIVLGRDETPEPSLGFQSLLGVVESMATFVAILDCRGILKELNRVPFDSLTLSVSDLVGHPFTEMPWWTESEETIDHLRVAIARAAAGEVTKIEERFSLEGAGRGSIELTISGISDESTIVTHVLVAAVDRSKLTRAQQELGASEERFLATLQYQRRLLNASPIGLVLCQLDGTIVDSNDAFARIIGRSTQEALRLTMEQLTPERFHAADEAISAKLTAEGIYGPYEKELIHASGCSVLVRLSGRLIDRSGEQLVWSSVEDVTEQKNGERQLQLLASVFEHSGEAILITDRNNNIVSVNAAFTRLTGYDLDDVHGKNPRILSAGQSPPEQYKEMWEQISATGLWQGEIWDRRKDGTVYPKWLTISVVRDEGGEITHYIGNFADLTDRKLAQQNIDFLTNHDVLTRLPNRPNVLGRLHQALETAKRTGEIVAVMFIDLNRFKLINDTLGHRVGDELLIEVGKRLSEVVRGSDVVARLGGDVFVVVATALQSAEGARMVARNIVEKLAEPYSVIGNEIRTTPNIGVALFPADADAVEVLMRRADLAMYHAKAAGRDAVRFFSPEMDTVATDRLRIERDLRAALERDEFVLQYQPQVDLDTGLIFGVEALARWQHPELGLLPPGRFIPIAEETGLIVALGERLLLKACAQLRTWKQQGLSTLRMAVNLSAHQLRHESLPGLIERMLTDFQIDPIMLELEITESAAMENAHETVKLLKRFRAMGLELSIDDFGTGYSSLNYLKLFPIQRLKVDHSFVRDMETDAHDAVICSATISLAHALGLEVVAEGVETAFQYAELKRMGCDLVQGFYLSRPLSPAHLFQVFGSLK